MIITYLKILKSLCFIAFISVIVFTSHLYISGNTDFFLSKYFPVSLLQYEIIKPFCTCSKHENKYILVEKFESRTGLDDNLFIISSLIEFKKTGSKKKTYLFNLTLNEAQRFNKTCDLYNVLRRGPNQKIISYSLYGKNPKYSHNLEEIAHLIRLKYKGYTARVHYDSTVNESIRCRLECEYSDVLDFCNMNEFSTSLNEMFGKTANVIDMKYLHKMMWRFLPIGDSFVDVIMSRDTDSFFTDREVDAVNAWLNSNKPFHIMRGLFI